ncbi:ATP-binding cassette domain-containing protein [Enterococcus avium]|uniref:ABC transporter ATP-binding protein n=1 Tax=Enterococcus avium TaxID=33945 RepID=UPI0035170655
MILLEVTGLYKYFEMYSTQLDKLKSLFIRKREKNYFCALEDVSFNIIEGEVLGIIGLNGSGKSTLSNIITGALSPSSGILNVNGTTALLGVGIGLNNSLSGSENIRQKCLLLGFSLNKIETIYQDVVDFSELEEFIDQPVKNYSSGMKARLGFSISIQLDPDLLVIDEALAVGDKSFYNKCLIEIQRRKSIGKSIVFISHSLAQIESISDRVMWLNYGKIQEIGEAKKVINNYKKFVGEYKKKDLATKQDYVKKQKKQPKNLSIKRYRVQILEDRNSKRELRFNISILTVLLVLISIAIIRILK